MNWRNWLITWAATAVAVWVAILVLRPFGMIEASGAGFVAAIVVGAFLGFLDAWVKPILKFLSCGCIVATLGIFLLFLNAFVLWLAGWFARLIGVNFYVSFWGAFWGAIIISIITFLLGLFLPDPDADAN